jgi:hypothetical protein
VADMAEMTTEQLQQIEVDLAEQLAKCLEHTGPIPYNDAGHRTLTDAVQSAWDAMPQSERDELAVQSTTMVAKIMGVEVDHIDRDTRVMRLTISIGQHSADEMKQEITDAKHSES